MYIKTLNCVHVRRKRELRSRKTLNWCVKCCQYLVDRMAIYKKHVCDIKSTCECVRSMHHPEEEVEEDVGLERCNKQKRHRFLRMMRLQRLRDEELNRALHAVMAFVYVAFNVFVFCLHAMGLWLQPSVDSCAGFGTYMLVRAIFFAVFCPFAVAMQLLLPEWPTKSFFMGCLVMVYSLCFLVADASLVPRALLDEACVSSLSAATRINLLGAVGVCNLLCGTLNVLLLFAYFLTVAFCGS